MGDIAISKEQHALNKRLLEAAMACNASAIAHALQDGADVDTQGGEKDGHAMHWAACFKHTDALKVLLEAGAEVNPRSYAQNTPLHDAAYWDNLEGIKLLLAAGADPALKSGKDTPIDLARRWGHKECADCLQSVADNPAKRPTPEEVELDMDKRIAALEALGKPLGHYTQAERKRAAQRETREAQRQAALRGEGI